MGNPAMPRRSRASQVRAEDAEVDTAHGAVRFYVSLAG
jgi:hypothetical protein